jgi:tetratricopeptide (TPR) repeat protein
MMSRRFIIAMVIVIGVIGSLSGCSQKYRKPVEGEVVLNHTVRDGETTADIADDYYGNAERSHDLEKFNDIDGDPAAGDVVRVPMTPDEMTALHSRQAARVPYNSGLDLVERGAYLDATTKFRRAIELDPGFAEAHYNLGVTYQRMKSYDRALASCQEAARLRPDNADYHAGVGNARFYDNDYERAASSYEQALAVDAEHLKACYSLAVCYERLRRISDARVQWNRYLELDSTSEWAEQARKHIEELP